VAVLARDQQKLDRGELAIVGELDATVVGGSGGGEHLDDQARLGERAGPALGWRAGHGQIGLIPGVGAVGGDDPGFDHDPAGSRLPM
jgi:hypothetical protein